jgi:hypothetical protein
MTSRERLIEAVDRLCLPVGEYIVGGSGSMVLHGMDRELGDLDIFCTTRLWFELMERDKASRYSDPFAGRFYLVTPNVHTHERFDPPILRRWYENLGPLPLKVDVFYAWKTRLGREPLVLEDVFKNHTVEIDGIRTCTLDKIFAIKEPLSDEKHAKDREAIREFQMDHPWMAVTEQDQRRSYPHLVPKLPSGSSQTLR